MTWLLFELRAWAIIKGWSSAEGTFFVVSNCVLEPEEFPGELLILLEMDCEWCFLLSVREFASTPEAFLSAPMTRKSACVITRISKIPKPNVHPAKTNDAPVWKKQMKLKVIGHLCCRNSEKVILEQGRHHQKSCWLLDNLPKWSLSNLHNWNKKYLKLIIHTAKRSKVMKLFHFPCQNTVNETVKLNLMGMT
jgi:hypothetical protein